MKYQIKKTQSDKDLTQNGVKRKGQDLLPDMR